MNYLLQNDYVVAEIIINLSRLPINTTGTKKLPKKKIFFLFILGQFVLSCLLLGRKSCNKQELFQHRF